MYDGGLQKVTITRQDDHTASIKIGEDKLLEIEFNQGRKVAVHKRKKEKPVAVDAQELILLHFFQGLTTQETADALNTSQSTVQRRLKKAEELLKGSLTGGVTYEG